MDVLPNTAITPLDTPDALVPPGPAVPPGAAHPPAKAAPQKPRRRLPITHCLNCDAPATGRYCAACGQETHDQSVALGTLASELAAEALSFDSKVLRTVTPLLLRPGFLTNEFNRGRRVRYLSPVKMYLVISALFFLALSRQVPLDKMNMLGAPAGASISSAQREALVRASTRLQAKGAQAKTPAERAALREAQVSITETLGSASPLSKPPHPPHSVHIAIGPDNIDAATLPTTVAAYDAQQAALPPARRDRGIKRFLLRRVVKTRQSPKELAQGFVDDLPRMMFVLLPAFAFLLKITYWRTKRLYVSHLIFALHTHAFVFLLLTGVLLLPAKVQGTALPLSLLLTSVHLLGALKGVYRAGWGRTLLAFGWLGFNYVFLLSFAFLLTLGAAFLLA